MRHALIFNGNYTVTPESWLILLECQMHSIRLFDLWVYEEKGIQLHRLIGTRIME